MNLVRLFRPLVWFWWIQCISKTHGWISSPENRLWIAHFTHIQANQGNYLRWNRPLVVFYIKLYLMLIISSHLIQTLQKYVLVADVPLLVATLISLPYANQCYSFYILLPKNIYGIGSLVNKLNSGAITNGICGSDPPFVWNHYVLGSS